MREDLLNTDAAGMTEVMSSLLPDVDKRAMLDNKELGLHLTSTIKEALKSNNDGWVDDDLACLSPWGFDITQIQIPVSLFQGGLDRMVPFAHGTWLVSQIPKSQLNQHLEQGEGHISIFLGRTDEMLDELLAAAPK